MYIIDEETGDMTIRQGDSIELTISNIPDDKEYDIYFSIYNSNREILFELKEIPVNKSVTFKLKPAQSTKLSVPKNSKTATYFYGVKRCYEAENFEDTLLIGNKSVSELNKILVYPLIVEGAENANS